MNSKKEIRAAIKSQRSALPPQIRETASRKICDNILSLKLYEQAETIALYMALPGEVAIEDLFPACLSAGKRVCIPHYDEVTKIYTMAEITEKTELRLGKYNIPEPVEFEKISTDEIDLFVVPGVAFAPDGTRLGRGGGYYDRLLEAFSGTRIGAAFDFQVYPVLPSDPHDRPVDLVVTESQIIKV